jgi:hypothetical protein
MVQSLLVHSERSQFVWVGGKRANKILEKEFVEVEAYIGLEKMG